ncbi:NADH-quinone oxidoreductase subunit C [Streptomyces xantholiticus]
MNPYDSLPDAVTEIFGEEATAERTYELLTVDVPADSWIAALEIARDKLGCTYFDWLSAVDEPGTGFRVCAHVVSLEGRTVRRLLVRTTVSHTAPSLASAVDVYAGASWHERETHEMFGVDFTGHPNQAPLLLPDGFEGHPLRKDFVLAARVAKAWPGAKEPGESEHGGPKRRQMLPPGVPDPNEWGPLKGQLPPAPARPARTPRAGVAGAAGTGERPARRTRSTSEGSASQAEAAAPTGTPRRSRSASEGSASQAEAAAPTGTPRRSRSASEGSASQGEAGTASAPSGAADPTRAPARSGSSDAPWHHARPAFDGADTAAEPSVPTDKPGPEAPAADAPGPKAPAAEAPAPTAPAPDVPAAEAPAPTASATDAPPPEAPDPKTPDPDAVGDPASESESPRPETTRPAPGSADGPDDEPNRPAGGEPA